jgi:hypothetical protein
MNDSLSSNAWPTRYTRRLSDHVLIAFHHACDQDEVEVARRLLDLLEFMVRRPPRWPGGRERRVKASLVAAYERLWSIQQQESPGGGVKGTSPLNAGGCVDRS